MNIDQFKKKIDNLKTHKQKNIGTSLKKPLLLLLLISKIENNKLIKNEFHYNELEKELDLLINKFGGRSGKPHSEQPFHHMNSSGFWHLRLFDEREFNNNTTLSKTVLRNPKTYGFFDEEVFKLLTSDKDNRKTITSIILEKYWPETIQHDLLVTLNIENLGFLKRKRDPNFVKEVLSNYRGKCSICGFTGIFNNIPFGVDAAHIVWHAFGGSDEVTNGIALCKLHHWTFDRGAITINAENLKVKVSSKFMAQENISIRLIEEFDNILIDSYRKYAPDSEYLDWHNKNIFIQ